LLLPFPEHFFITFFGATVTKSCEKQFSGSNFWFTVVI